jgi:hypothetical protein
LFFDRRRQQLARMSFQILGARAEQMDFDIAGASDFSKESEIPED